MSLYAYIKKARWLVRIALALALLFLAAGICLWAWVPKEPTYDNKPLSYWMTELRTSGPVDMQQHPRVKKAFHAMGEDCVPFLMKNFQSRNNYPFWLRKTFYRLTGYMLDNSSGSPLQAARAFQVLGTNASSAVPEIRSSCRNPKKAHMAAFILTYIDPNAAQFFEELLPHSDSSVTTNVFKAASRLIHQGHNPTNLVKKISNCLTHPQLTIRHEAIVTLERIHKLDSLHPPLVIPALTNALAHGANPGTKIKSLRLLSNFGSEAQSVIPFLENMKSNSEAEELELELIEETIHDIRPTE